MILVDRFDAWAERHSRLLDVVGFAWLMLSAAIAARFIVLPEIPFVSEQLIFWTGVGVNAVWWAVVRPRIQLHRAARESARKVSHG